MLHNNEIDSFLRKQWASLVAQLVRNLPAMWESWVGKIPWRSKRLPIPVLWPGEFHGRIVHGVAKSRTRLSDFTHSLSFMIFSSLHQVRFVFETQILSPLTRVFKYHPQIVQQHIRRVIPFACQTSKCRTHTP